MCCCGLVKLVGSHTVLLVEVGSQVMGGKMGRYLVRIPGDVLMTDLV